jgi:hypothetical protein
MAHKPSAGPTLFSYVVDHDLGFAPNPFGGYCTLVHCKFGGKTGRRNVVELADVGDWVIGTGGKGKDSAGHGRIIYLMRVDQKPQFSKYLSERRFQGRSDCEDFGRGNRYALVSRRFFYFGRTALRITDLPEELTENIAKRGAGFRSDYPMEKLKNLVKWFQKNYDTGMHGFPCGAKHDTQKARRRIACG